MALVGKGKYRRLKQQQKELRQRVGNKVSLLNDTGATVLYIAGDLEDDEEKGSILVVNEGKAVRATGIFTSESGNAEATVVNLTYNDKSYIITYSMDDPHVYRIELHPDAYPADRTQGDPEDDRFRMCTSAHVERYVNGERTQTTASMSISPKAVHT